MSLTLKLSSLAIRTLSKPIANHIKAQASEHERFRKVCIAMAQALHRFDMRLRLGAVRDNAASQRRAAANAAVRKHKPTSPTAKTEAETKAEDDAIAKAKAAAEEAAKPVPTPHIRPLSESKAIESGATFISETFLFIVAGGLIVFESWRSRRKETTRREDVEARLVELEKSEKAARDALLAVEKELLAQKAKHGELSKSSPRILPREVWDIEKQGEAEPTEQQNWWTQITSYLSFGQTPEQQAESVIRESKKTTPKPSAPVSEPILPQRPASHDQSLESKKA
ncbi:optic atrophy 3 protein-domain-containing protein [Aspergillus coremiiformis]|uniref:Optic atrophy 3 protein-domain-containing protein n=1 Tax=Aspergillus coremiiformis TaxID=138285 RepID=A0A5N6YYB1_9EURO|nr:optic atrophy 3 protein-domain-containing protein [Aspergillus coremiiformis]